ncbi:MAG: hypothetical protein JXR73_16930 [Candidatus Omnitrophica bacterium]|nr:hypothetical protein [Candidatus Omnitrophota bacterium]
MDNILLEEEQISLLGKMLYYSAKHLTSRERETYDQLVEDLLRKVRKKREMGHRQKEEEFHILSAQLEAKKNAMRKKSPEDICRLFVESWNKQDFETEFFCLAQCFPMRKKKTNDINEYVFQRMGKYQDRRSVGPIAKKIIEITSSQMHGNKTSIYCIELHKMPGKDLTLHREYEFLYEDHAWRIADFETIKSHEVVSDRKMYSS